MIRFTVVIKASYHNRDGSVRSRIMFSKSFLRPFVPQIRSEICIESEDLQISSMVTDVWWNALDDAIMVHTETICYSDGDVDLQREKHIKFLNDQFWCMVSQ